MHGGRVSNPLALTDDFNELGQSSGWLLHLQMG
jgi:hypothetical protein